MKNVRFIQPSWWNEKKSFRKSSKIIICNYKRINRFFFFAHFIKGILSQYKRNFISMTNKKQNMFNEFSWYQTTKNLFNCFEQDFWLTIKFFFSTFFFMFRWSRYKWMIFCYNPANNDDTANLSMKKVEKQLSVIFDETFYV